MAYYFSKVLSLDFQSAILKVTEQLKNEGFGIITEINVNETFKKKLNVDFKNYRILGACNPSFAYQALQVEDKIGTMLPCNVTVIEIDSETVEIAAINPLSSMQLLNNPELTKIAEKVSEKLEKVVHNL